MGSRTRESVAQTTRPPPPVPLPRGRRGDAAAPPTLPLRPWGAERAGGRWGCLFCRSTWRDRGAGSACPAAADAESSASPRSRSIPRGRREGRSARVGLPPPRRLSSASRALCASHESRTPRGSHTSGAPPASPTTCAPSSAGESGAGSGGVTRECARGAAVGGSGADFGRVTGESSAEAAAHPNAGGGGSVRPGKRCPSMARRTVSTRSAWVMLAARAAAPSCAAAASAIVCSRSMRSLSALSIRLSASARRPRSSVGTGSSRAPSSAIVRSASVRRVSIAMRALSPSARGSRVRSHSSAKRSVSRCRQISPSMRSAWWPSAGRACAQRRARGIKGERSPSPERTRATISVQAGAVLDRCGHGVLDCSRQRLVR